METRNLKKIEHKNRCRLCWAAAVLRRGRRYYCAKCYHAVFQTPTVDQSLVVLDDATVIRALVSGDLVTARAAADILDRILKERTV